MFEGHEILWDFRKDKSGRKRYQRYRLAAYPVKEMNTNLIMSCSIEYYSRGMELLASTIIN